MLSTPKRLSSVPISFMVEPNTEREHTTWSPALSVDMQSKRMADIPLPVPIQASISSSAAKRFSMLVTVGLEKRE